METHRDTWRHCGGIQRHTETCGDTRRHMKTCGDTWRHTETRGDTWRHTETWRHGDTPYKICSQIKTDIYDAISSLALIGPMS